MQSVSPVFSRFEEKFERVIALEQTQYEPVIGLPIDIHATDPATGGTKILHHAAIAVRFRLNDEEREKIAAGADLVVTEMIFGKLFTPLNFQFCQSTERPEF